MTDEERLQADFDMGEETNERLHEERDDLLEEIRALEEEVANLQKQITGHVARIASQSDQLARRARKSIREQALESVLRRMVALYTGPPGSLIEEARKLL